MILSDREIQAAIRGKTILIDPVPDEAFFSSTALDLTLNHVLLRWKEPGDHPSGQPIKLWTLLAQRHLVCRQRRTEFIPFLRDVIASLARTEPRNGMNSVLQPDLIRGTETALSQLRSRGGVERELSRSPCQRHELCYSRCLARRSRSRRNC